MAGGTKMKRPPKAMAYALPSEKQKAVRPKNLYRNEQPKEEDAPTGAKAETVSRKSLQEAAKAAGLSALAAEVRDEPSARR